MSDAAQTNVMVQGRIVWVAGDLFKGAVKKDGNTKMPIIDQKTGQQVIEYGFGLAVPMNQLNNDPTNIWAASFKEAVKLYPSQVFPPAFAWKRKNGDTDIDEKGVAYSQRTGYAGHMVFALTTRIPIKFFVYDVNTKQNIHVNEGIKCGDYVNVQVSIKAHPPVGNGKPGLYLNPNAAQLIHVGEAIVNTPSGDSIFGGAAPQAPQGAISPSAPTQMLVPTGPVGGQPPMPGQPMPQQGFAQPAMPQAPIQPHHGVLPQQFQPQQGMPQAPMQPTAQMMPSYPQVPQGYPQMGNAPVQGVPMMPTGFPQTASVAPAAFPSNSQQPAGFPQVPGFPQQ